jgi:hypothetical protein
LLFDGDWPGRTVPVLRLVLRAFALSKQAETSRSPATAGSRITRILKILIVPLKDSVVTSGLASRVLTWRAIVRLT